MAWGVAQQGTSAAGQLVARVVASSVASEAERRAAQTVTPPTVGGWAP